MPTDDQGEKIGGIEFRREASSDADSPEHALSSGNEGDEIGFRAVLRNREFVKILSGQFFSNFGDAVLRISLLLYVYEVTGSKTKMTLVLSMQIIPWIIVGPVAGVLADRISRKGIMVASDLLRAVALCIIPLVTDIASLMVIAFIIGVASASFTAPRAAALPEITGMKLFVKAISLSQLVFQMMSTIGPLLGAFLYALVGSSAFFLSAICYVVSATILFATRIPSASRDAADKLSVRVVFNDLGTGIKFLFGTPVLRQLMILFAFMLIGLAFAGSLVYPYIFEIMHNGLEASGGHKDNLEKFAQHQFGIIGALAALGTIIGNLTFGRFEGQIGRRSALFFGFAAVSGYYLAFAFEPSFALLAALCVAMGIWNGMSSLAINAIFAESVPNEIRGRAYSAANAYVQTFAVLATALSGLAADIFGVVEAIVGASVFLILALSALALSTGFFKYASVDNAETITS